MMIQEYLIIKIGEIYNYEYFTQRITDLYHGI
jgi:hypothetical protein